MGEDPVTELARLVSTLHTELLPCFEKPCAFFGHSMGALIGFEVARSLQMKGGPGPIHLFASGRRAPQLPDRFPPLHNLPEPQFIERLGSFKWIPKEVLASRELLTTGVPILRKDLEICETYGYSDGPPLGCPITAYGGIGDELVDRWELEAWAEQTTESFSCHMFPGDHFFLSSSRPLMLQTLGRQLQGTV
jgi:medium-chain acyl-[acyl-carrier-protein] hydrolase